MPGSSSSWSTVAIARLTFAPDTVPPTAAAVPVGSLRHTCSCSYVARSSSISSGQSSSTRRIVSRSLTIERHDPGFAGVGAFEQLGGVDELGFAEAGCELEDGGYSGRGVGRHRVDDLLCGLAKSHY